MSISYQFSVFILALFHVCNASLNQNLTPFELEIRSESGSDSGNFELELREKTAIHLNSFFAKNIDNFEHLSLTTRAFKREVAVKGGGLRGRDSDPDFSLDSIKYTSSVIYEGTITLKESLIEKNDLQNLQLNAFIGQSKLDYLTIVQFDTYDFFLLDANNVILAFKEAHNQSQSTHASDNKLLIFIVASSLIVVVLIGATIGILCCLAKTRTVENMKSHTRKKNELMVDDIPDIGLISIGSVSLHTDTVPSDDSIESSSPTNGIISSVAKKGAGSQSMASTDTIDVNGSIDMIAWKNQIATGNEAPFETDITMIGKDSPNKTLKVDKKLYSMSSKQLVEKKSQKVKKTSTNGNYLSKESLKELGQKNRFVEHSTRYHDRVYGKKRSGRKYRSVNSRYSERNNENGTIVSHGTPMVKSKRSQGSSQNEF